MMRMTKMNHFVANLFFFERVNINFALFNFYFKSDTHTYDDSIKILWSNSIFFIGKKYYWKQSFALYQNNKGQ